MQDYPGPLDVTVIGGGLAGMAAAIHLARAGLQVVCIEADPANADPVGESLDWSAPELLRVLGLSMDTLLSRGIATYKRHVVLRLRNGSDQHYVPGDWLARAPFYTELRTLHVDRTGLDQALREILLSHDIQLIRDKVLNVERVGRRITAVVTEGDVRISSRWFIDASGEATRLFPRLFQLAVNEYGPRKVAIWDYFAVPESIEGTTLLADGEGPPYMEWIWQIPIHSNTISVGYVATGESIKEKRRQGHSVAEIFRTQLGRFADLKMLVPSSDMISPRVTSFHCRVYEKISGPNWLVAGESAAMVDPMTSNGVTAALRHASEASSLIARYRNRRQLPWLPRTMYSRRVLDMASFFNYGIEKVIYDWPIRNRIGAFNAGDLYTIPAWSVNNIYSRVQPRGVVLTTLFGAFLAIIRAAFGIFYWWCQRSSSASPVCAAP